MSAYWDPTVAMDHLLSDPPAGHAAPWTISGRNTREEIFGATWADRDWRNVPGPFYAAETDTCGGGRFIAPHLILVNEDWTEFVSRQPVDSAQVLELLDVAYDDPFSEYGCDGDDHWTLSEIRAWWADRRRVVQWIESAVRVMADQGANEEIAGLRLYAADIHGPLEDRLRAYAFRADNGESARLGDRLPSL